MPGEDFQRVVESLRVAVALADAQGVVAFANPAFAQLAGVPGHAAAGASLPSLFHRDDGRRVHQGVARVAAGKAASALLDVRTAAGGAWVQLALQPALDASDRAAGVVAVLHDIAGQRETETALNLSSARLLAMAESMPNAVLIENGAGEVELVNEAFCRLLGLRAAPQSLLGLPAVEVVSRAEALAPGALDGVHRAPDAPTTIPLHPPGRAPLALERQPLLVDDASAGALWLSHGSVAPTAAGERGATEAALIEKIGGELLVALEGLAAVSIRAQQMEVAPALLDHLGTIRASTETAFAAIGDLVDFSKVEGAIELERADFRLRPAMAELVRRVVARAEEGGCRLRVKVEQDVPDCLEGDVERLQLALRNLLDSAFAVAPGAEVTLAITPEFTTAGGIQLGFAVSLGPGGPEPGAPRTSAEAGMGVAVARFMVAGMGGRLAVNARPGAETLYAFSVELPARRAPPPPPRPSYVSLVGLPVLVASHDPDQRHELTAAMRRWRMVPLEADNANMAIALLERLQAEGTPVPLLITTNRLPVQDGFLLAFRVRHHPQLAATLVVMLATDGRPGDAIACRENGIAAYLRHPASEQQLNDAIVAVTGASLDADETPTLVTRHSLREQRKGATILLLDAHRDTHMLAAHILRKRDCSLVVAHDLPEAIEALDQDLYDLVVADVALAGSGAGEGAATLRAHLGRDGRRTRLYATAPAPAEGFAEAMAAQGWDGTLAKPLRRDDLLAVLRAMGKLAGDAEDGGPTPP